MIVSCQNKDWQVVMLTVAVTAERSRRARGRRCWRGGKRWQGREERTGFITRRVITLSLRAAKHSRLLVPVAAVVVVDVGVVAGVPDRTGVLDIVLLDWVDKAIVFCCGKLPGRRLGQ